MDSALPTKNSRPPSSKGPEQEPKVVPEPTVTKSPYPAERKRLYLAVFVSNISAFCFGVSAGWTVPAEEPVLHGDEYGFTPTSSEWTWVCAILTLGAASWCLPMGILMNFCGSRMVILFQLVPYTIGWSLIAFARSVIWLYVGRFFLGMCGGGLCVAVPVYSAEVAPVHQRGSMGCTFYGACICGLTYSFVLGEFFSLLTTNIISLCLFLLCLAMIFVPDSPVFYARRGKLDKAEAALLWLRGKKYDARTELRLLLLDTTRSSTTLPSQFWTRMKRKQTRRSLCRASALMILEKLTGGIVFTLFVPHMLNHLGLSRFWIIMTFLFQIVGFLLCLFLVDRIGRRPVFLVATFLLFFSAFSLGCIFETTSFTDIIAASSLLSLCIFIGSYSAGLGPLSWLLNVEIVAARMRPLICSLTATFNWLTAFLLIRWYSTSYQFFGPPRIFFLFSIVSLFSCIFALLFIPETKGLTTPEIMKKLKGLMNREQIPTIQSTTDISSV